MQSAFQAGDFEGGLLRAVDAVDALLVRHFAARPGDVDVNELPDCAALPLAPAQAGATGSRGNVTTWSTRARMPIHSPIS